ncbi:MAG: hypothetical protein MUD06_09330 [Rhodospirillales bacterium]|nr:hypothetical protein [Rhodospirillales bacterium]
MDAAPTTEPDPGADGLRPLSRDDAAAIVEAGIDRYIRTRHDRVAAFVDETYSLAGSLRLHRQAVGYDVLRAPANVALALPYLLSRAGAAALGRVGAERWAAWLGSRRIFFDTDVARELGWRLHTQLLELPYEDGPRRSDRDALADAMLADPRLADAFAAIATAIDRHRSDPEVRRRLTELLASYTGSRTAAAEVVNNLLLAGTGAAVLKELTPGAISLGPALAAAIAHQAAVASFPLGAGLGGLWYGVFATAPSAALVVGVTGGLMLVAAATTAFAGILSDPLLRKVGLHRRRLHHLIDVLGDQLKGRDERAFAVRDHYVARIFDLVDLLRTVYRVAH